MMPSEEPLLLDYETLKAKMRDKDANANPSSNFNSVTHGSQITTRTSVRA